MKGRRLEGVIPNDLGPGDYALIDGVWYLKPPKGPRGKFIDSDDVVQNPDGTITIDALIDSPAWCGVLKDGVWSSYDWRQLKRLREQRKLDTYLAINLMGWEKIGPQIWKAPDSEHPLRDPNFSRSDESSVLVVNKMRDVGLASFNVGRSDDGTYTAYFRNDEEHYEATADTVPHAICLAARKWTEAQIEYRAHFKVNEEQQDSSVEEQSGFIEDSEAGDQEH
jgi:hypothetical protein